jgi:hypothetical protein
VINTNIFTLEGIPDDPISKGLTISISGGNGANNQQPDGISPLIPATEVFTYQDSSYDGGIKVDTGVYRLVYFSFGFEAISTMNNRIKIMDNIINWLIPDDILQSDVKNISASKGGTVKFMLDAGVENAGRNYILLGSMSGTEPGISLPGGTVTLPLNWDVFTDIIWQNINTPFFQNFLGILDSNGQATAQMHLDQLQPIMVGHKMYFAFACNNPWDIVSNHVEIEIVE